MLTLKLGLRPGHNRSMHSSVGLNVISLVGIPVGGGALKRHALVLIPGPVLWHMRLDCIGWVLVLHRLHTNNETGLCTELHNTPVVHNTS